MNKLTIEKLKELKNKNPKKFIKKNNIVTYYSRGEF